MESNIDKDKATEEDFMNVFKELCPNGEWSVEYWGNGQITVKTSGMQLIGSADMFHNAMQKAAKKQGLIK